MKWTTPADRRLTVFLFLFFTITLLLRLVLLGYYRPDYGGIDMNVIYGIQRMILGQPLYQDPQQPLYGVIQYTPLFYICCSYAGRLLGIDGLDVQSVYVIARSLALICNLMMLGIGALMLRSWYFSRQQALAFSLPLLMMLTTHYYQRGDSMHLFFFAASMYMLVLFIRSGAWYYILAAALCSACCIVSKQSGMLCAGIIGCYLLFAEPKIRYALLYGSGFLLFTLLLLQLCIHGNWSGLYANAWLGLKNGISLDFLYTIFISQFYYDLIPCYFLGGIIVYTAFRKSKDRQFRFLATGAGLSFLFAVVTGLKIGSSNNYFTEFLFFVLLALPWLLYRDFAQLFLFRIRNYKVTIRRYGFIALIILVASKTLGFFTSMYLERRLVSEPERYARDQQLFRYFRDQLHIRPGEYIYFNESSFLNNIFIGYSILPTKDVVSQVYRCNPDTYDYSRFTAAMNTGLVRYVVVPEGDYTINRFAEELAFVRFDPERFRPLASIAGYRVYRFAAQE